ncbi:MAG TPA: ribokinase [Ligilactobacillus aviarius]|nr:ribokinase [Ligilactobacillus aviarius]
MNKVTVIGSINLDWTIRVARMAKPGETLHTKEIFTAGGGKGANQAIAAQRLGADTSFIGAVGEDREVSQTMLELLHEDGINCQGIATLSNHKTGQAFVIVDDDSENLIYVHGGANMAFKPEHVDQNRDLIIQRDFVVAQFETPIDCTTEAFKIARQNGVVTILNPAPAIDQIPKELLKVTDMIVPNETETEVITGIKITDQVSMVNAAEKFHALGIKAVLITLGSQGTFYSYAGKTAIIPALKVNAVDTTAAGDTFIGALSSVLNKDFSNLEDAIKFSNKASSITVQRFGAQPSIPYLKEMEA